MSWSINTKGPKDQVIETVNQQLTQSAASYEGMAEKDDVLACRDRIVALVQATNLDSDSTAPGGYEVEVAANGSHSGVWENKADGSWGMVGLSQALFQVSIIRKPIAITGG